MAAPVKPDSTVPTSIAGADDVACSAAGARVADGKRAGPDMLEYNQDWFHGDDPGATAWPVTGADGAFITTTNNAWALQVFDITGATPETALTPSATPAGHAGAAGTTIYFTQLAAPVVDGYWTKGGTGYNMRSYVPNAGYQVAGSTFIPGHEYLFQWTVTTPEYDGTANKWGKITLIRRGRCLAKK